MKNTQDRHDKQAIDSRQQALLTAYTGFPSFATVFNLYLWTEHNKAAYIFYFYSKKKKPYENNHSFWSFSLTKVFLSLVYLARAHTHTLFF